MVNRRQQGYVLIQVLLIFALLSVLLANLLYNQQVANERSLRLVDEFQFRQWALSGEQYGKGVLLTADQAKNTKEEAWYATEEFGPIDLYYEFGQGDAAATLTVQLK